MANGLRPEMRRGMVGDRPWGVILGALATAGATGQLTLTAEDGKVYAIVLAGGGIAGASSPLASDAVVRVALKSQLVWSSQVPALARAVAAAPHRDEVAVVAELANLTPEQAQELLRRLLVQRAARTFSVDRGGYAFDERISIPAAPEAVVDVAPAIWLGARMNLAQDRLVEDLRRLGSRFVLHAEDAELARLELTEDERLIVQALRLGTSLPALEAKYRDLEPRAAQATIYALVALGLCEGYAPQVREGAEVAAGAAGDEDELMRAPTLTFDGPRRAPAAVDLARVPTEPAAVPAVPVRAAEELAAAAAVAAAAAAASADPVAEPPAPVRTPRTRTISSAPPLHPRFGNPIAIRELIGLGIARLEMRADHFALLGVPRDASIDAIRSAYVALASHLRPDKLPELDLAAARDAQRLFAHVNIAFGVLSDPERRAEYLAQLQGGAAPARLAGPPVAGTSVERVTAAAEVAQQGMRALRREDLPAAIELLTRATELAPNEVDHAAALAWARFCAAPDKAGIAGEVRRVLERAIFKSPRPVLARFYLGRVERMLGRVREAVHHFHEVLELEPGHADAAAELRLLEPRAIQK